MRFDRTKIIINKEEIVIILYHFETYCVRNILFLNLHAAFSKKFLVKKELELMICISDYLVYF